MGFLFIDYSAMFSKTVRDNKAVYTITASAVVCYWEAISSYGPFKQCPTLSAVQRNSQIHSKPTFLSLFSSMTQQQQQHVPHKQTAKPRSKLCVHAHIALTCGLASFKREKVIELAWDVTRTQHTRWAAAVKPCCFYQMHCTGWLAQSATRIISQLVAYRPVDRGVAAGLTRELLK